MILGCISFVLNSTLSPNCLIKYLMTGMSQRIQVFEHLCNPFFAQPPYSSTSANKNTSFTHTATFYRRKYSIMSDSKLSVANRRPHFVSISLVFLFTGYLERKVFRLFSYFTPRTASQRFQFMASFKCVRVPKEKL